MKSVVGNLLPILFLWGCGAPDIPREPLIFSEIPAPFSSGHSAVAELRPQGKITLGQAQVLGLSTHPRLRAAFQEIVAAHGGRIEAGLWNNPRLEAEVEDVAGAKGGLHGAEVTLSLSQEIPISSALSWGESAAAREEEMAGWEYEEEKTALLADVYLAFYQALLAQERERELTALARNFGTFVEKVKNMVDAGKSPRADLLRTEVAYAVTVTRVEEAQNSKMAAQKHLALLTSLPMDGFPVLEGGTVPDAVLPELSQLEIHLDSHPRILKIRARQEKFSSQQKQLAAQVWPDPEISVGVRRNYAENQNALVFGLGLNLPLLKRNQGSIVEAQALFTKAVHEEEIARRDLGDELYAAYHQYRTSSHNVKNYLDKILPAAEEALSLTVKGYEEGKLSVLEVVTAQQAEIESKLNLLGELANLHTALASLYKIAGTTTASDTGERRKR